MAVYAWFDGECHLWWKSGQHLRHESITVLPGAVI